MRFVCVQSCHDNTPAPLDLKERFRKGFRAGDGDTDGQEGYELTETDVKRLAAIGLFPECFDVGDEWSRRYIEEHREELVDIVRNRKLPFRPLRPGEKPMPKGPAHIERTAADMLGLGEELNPIGGDAPEDLDAGGFAEAEAERAAAAARKPATRKPKAAARKKAQPAGAGK